jgi:hypothetical protein
VFVAVIENMISRTMLHQRFRNGIIWYLETASSFEEQLKYQDAVPLVNVPNEMFNQWADWVKEDDRSWYGAPVFSPDEQAAMWEYNTVLNDVLDDVLETFPKLSELITTAPWERLRAAAEKAIEVFRRRGLFDQDVEQF